MKQNWRQRSLQCRADHRCYRSTAGGLDEVHRCPCTRAAFTKNSLKQLFRFTQFLTQQLGAGLCPVQQYP
jgi:hypothetical protein